MVIGPVLSLAVAPGPDGSLQLLAGCDDGSLRVLGNGAGGELQQQQAALVGHHSRPVNAVTVMDDALMAGPSSCWEPGTAAAVAE